MDYLRTVRALMDELESRSAKQTDAAAEAVVAALTAGNEFYVSSLGHGNDGDLLYRAGGLVAAQAFNFSLNVNDRTGSIERERPREEPLDAGLEAARLAVRSSHMRRGDCLVVGSVSGRSGAPISLAIAAGEIGVTVIGITSLEYSSRIQSTHSSGRRLMDVCDIVVDNCVPYGDAGMEIEGLPEKAIPMSGVATIVVCWMIHAQIIEKLLQQGLQPSFYISANRPDGPEFNENMRKQFNRQGY